MCRGQPSAAPLTPTATSATAIVRGTDRDTGVAIIPTSICSTAAPGTSEASTLLTSTISPSCISPTSSSAGTTECQTTTSANLFEGPSVSPTDCWYQPDQEEEESLSLSRAQIAGIALGSTGFVILVSAVVLWARQRRKAILQNGQSRKSFFAKGCQNSSRRADSPKLVVRFPRSTAQAMAHQNRDFRPTMFPRANANGSHPGLAADGMRRGPARNTDRGDIGLAVSSSGIVTQPLPAAGSGDSRKQKSPFPARPWDRRPDTDQEPLRADQSTQPRIIQTRRSLSSESGPTMILSASSASTTVSAGKASPSKPKPVLTLKIPTSSSCLSSSEPGPQEHPKQGRETGRSSLLVTPFEEDGEGSMLDSDPTRAKQIWRPPSAVGIQRYYVADPNGNWRLGDPSSPQRMSQLVELEAPSSMTKSPIELWEEEQDAARMRARQQIETRRNKKHHQRDIMSCRTPIHQESDTRAEARYGKRQQNLALASRINLKPAGHENGEPRPPVFCNQHDATTRPLQVAAATSSPTIRQRSSPVARGPATAHSFKQECSQQQPQRRDNCSHSSNLGLGAGVTKMSSSEGLGILERDQDDACLPGSTRTSHKLGRQNAGGSQAEEGWGNSKLGLSPVTESPASSGGKSPVTYPKIPKPSMSPLAGQDRAAFDRLDIRADKTIRMVKNSPRSTDMLKLMHKLPGQPGPTLGLTRPEGDEDGRGNLTQKSSTPGRRANPADQGNDPGRSLIAPRRPSQSGREGHQQRQIPLCENHLESPPRWKGPRREDNKSASRLKSPNSPKSPKSPSPFASPFIGSQSSTATPATSTGDEGASPRSPSHKQQRRRKEGGTASAQGRQPRQPHIAEMQSPASAAKSASTATWSSVPSSLLSKRVGEYRAAKLALAHEDAAGEQEGSPNNNKWRKAVNFYPLPPPGSSACALSRKDPRSNAHDDDAASRQKHGGGNGEMQLPLKSPRWIPELTPTRRGDDLFINVQ